VLGGLLIFTLESSDWDSVFLPALGLIAWAMCANELQLGSVARFPHAMMGRASKADSSSERF
jgi:hypothetical protein